MMSILPLNCLLVLLTLQATTVYCQGGHHSHTEYVDDHEISEVREEFDDKIKALEIKILGILSLFKQFYYTTSTSDATLRHYYKYALEQLQVKNQFIDQYIENAVSDLMENLTDYIGTTHYPAPSCGEIRQLAPNATSGQYWIMNPVGNVSQQYCDMEREACGTRGGWMRVAHLDMTQPDHSCPPGFRTNNIPKRSCGRPCLPGCVSVKFPTYNIPYNKVCGKVIAYQDKSPDAQCPHIGLDTDRQNHTLEEVYIDGVSLTHGTPGNRSHIWSFIASHGENLNDCRGCPCYNDFTGTRVSFIGNNFFCDSGMETWTGIRTLYHEDPLWDGQGCGSNSECCTFNNPPWFCTELDQSTSDDIELRLCADQDNNDEDVPIEHIELYIQ